MYASQRSASVVLASLRARLACLVVWTRRYEFGRSIVADTEQNERMWALLKRIFAHLKC